MKIVHVINSLATGGAERLVFDLTGEALRRGHDVKVLVLRDVPGVPRAAAKRHGIRVDSLDSHFLNARHFASVPRYLAGADIVHVHLFPAFYYAALSGVPKVYTEHSTSNRRMGKPVWRVPEAKAYNRYNEVVAISPGVGDAIANHLSRLHSRTPVSVVPNGIGREFFDPSGEPRVRNPGSPLRLVSVVRLWPVKDHSLALRVLSETEGVTLDIIGSGPLEDALRAQVADLGVASRVRLLGEVEDVAARLLDYDAMLNTSEYEGFSLSAAEAMARGLPVIGPMVSGFSDVVLDGETGLLFEDRSPASIAGKVKELMDPGRYLQLAKGARVTAERFSIETCASAYEALYERVLDDGAGHVRRGA